MVKNRIVKIVLGIIILMMVITVIGNYRVFYNPKKDYIISINGQKISRLQFEKTFNWWVSQLLLSQKFNEIFTNENAMEQFRNVILQNLIDEVLLQQYVNQLGININDDEIKSVILNQKDFMINGKFDNVKYRNVLNIMGITGKQYAETLRKQLAVQELLSTIVKTEFVLPNEVNQFKKLVLQKRVIRQAIIDIKSMAAKIPVSEYEIKTFYKKYLNYFMRPEQFKIRYLLLDVNKISNPYVSNLEIKQWYDLHKSDYIELPQYKYRIIQLKTEKEAKLLLNKLNTGANFVKLAQKYSIDPISARLGGQIGWIRTENLPNELKNINLQKIGQVSRIIKCPIGYLIVRLDGIQSQRIIPLNKVRNFIKNKIQQQKIFEKYSSLKKQISESRSISINELEYLTGMKTEETNWFNLTTTLPNHLNFPEVKQAILNGSHKKNINTFFIPLKNHSGFWIRILNHRPAYFQSLSRVHNIINTYLQRKKINKRVKKELNKILLLLRQGKTEADLRLNFGNARVITPNNNNTDENLLKTIFDLIHPKLNQSTYTIIQNTPQKIIIIALDKICFINASKKQTIAISSYMRKNQINMFLVALLNDLRKKSIIKYNNML
ncbi:MAG: peptidylprolyl isomerase [Candidatus Dasytiphilus stammeri]